MLIGTVAIINWLVITLALDLQGALSTLVSLYRKTFYPLFLITELLFSVTIPSRVKDLLLLYFSLGGVTLRTWQSLLKRIEDAAEATIGDYGEPRSIFFLTNANSSFLNAVFLAFSFLTWPLAIRTILRRPVMVLSGSRLHLWVPADEYREVLRENVGDAEVTSWTVIDIRLVWILQVSGMALAILSAIGLHEFLSS